MPENSRSQVLLLDADLQRGEKLKERETTVCFHADLSKIDHTLFGSGSKSQNSSPSGFYGILDIPGLKKYNPHMALTKCSLLHGNIQKETDTEIDKSI